MISPASPALLSLLAAAALLSLTLAALPGPPPLVTPSELAFQAVESIVDLRGICLGGRILASGRALVLLADPEAPLSVPVFLPGAKEELVALDLGVELVIRGRRIALEDGPGLSADWSGVQVREEPRPEATLRAVLTFPELYRGESLLLRGTWLAPADGGISLLEVDARLVAGMYSLVLRVPAELLEQSSLKSGAQVRVEGILAYEPERGLWVLRVDSLEVERSG